jgi:hypothetical protein
LAPCEALREGMDEGRREKNGRTDRIFVVNSFKCELMRDWIYGSRMEGGFGSMVVPNTPMRGFGSLCEKEEEEYGKAFFNLEVDWEIAWSADSNEGRGIRDKMLDFRPGFSLSREEMRGTRD